MKIKVLSRNPDDYLRETKRDIQRVQRNYDPSLHPFETAREYVRALNATKLERVFAKPFLGSLDGHRDSLSCLQKHNRRISCLASGSCDGMIKIWNLASRCCTCSVQAHDGVVKGITFRPGGQQFLTCGMDKVIKLWEMNEENLVNQEPLNTILGKSVFQCITHHQRDNVFATCGDQVDIWDQDRSVPIRSFTWGVDSLHHINFNPIETNILGACASDRSIILYDMRGSAPLKKVILKLKSNALAWNPMEAFVFTVANEDYNLYTFDMRNLSTPCMMHTDHVSAVMDVDYSPTGKEFVTAGYDKCLRIFPYDQPHSREIYHTKRMQRVNQVQWTKDNTYILSGSDEMNIRLWKAWAPQKLGLMKPRERVSLEYSNKLKEKFGNHPQIKRIARHRHVPRTLYKAAQELRTIKESQKRKEANRRAHSKPGAVPFVAEKRKHIVKEVE